MAKVLGRFQSLSMCAIGMLLPWGSNLSLMGISVLKLLLLWGIALAVLRLLCESPFERRLDGVHLSVMTLCVWLLLSVLWSISPEDSLHWTASFCLAILVSLLVRFSVCTRQEWTLVGVSYVIGCVVAAVSLWQVVRHGGFVPRLSLENVNANNLSYGVVTGLPVVWSILLARTIRRKWVSFSMMAFYAVALIFTLAITGTRSVLFALVAWIVVILFYALRRRPRSIIFLLCGVAIVVWIATRVVPEYTLKRLTLIGEPSQTQSWSMRSVLWEIALKTFLSHPLAGVGPGAFPKLNFWGIYAHNITLSLLSQVGIVGFVLYFGLVWRLARTSLLRGTRNWAFWAWVSLLVVWLVIGSTGVWETAWAVWFVIGWSSAIPVIFRSRKAPKGVGPRAEFLGRRPFDSVVPGGNPPSQRVD